MGERRIGSWRVARFGAAWLLALLFLEALVVTVPGRVWALAPYVPQESLGSADPRLFDEQVLPLLRRECVRCHGLEQTRSSFSMATRSSFLRGGTRGSPYSESESQRSLLLEAVGYDNHLLRMPPSGRLSEEDRQLLRTWVEAGLPWGSEVRIAPLDAPELVATSELEILQRGREYWAYQPIVAPGSHRSSERHAVDVLLDRSRDATAVKAVGAADRVSLLRRASYDLTGLPPTPEEVDDFVDDSSAEAWGRVVDRLLDSPHFGEKWGRHWLDLVRYAETNGYERDTPKLNMWRYRDYVIRAFNSDTPYDKFMQQQIAGDEFDDPTPDDLIATGFHRLMIWDDEPSDRRQARADLLGDIVDVTGQAFLGTTLGCARCHDHKKDPITQRDYFAMMAFFNNLSPFGTDKHITRDVPDPPRPGEDVWSSLQRDAEIARLEQELSPLLARLEEEWLRRGLALPEPVREVFATSEQQPQSWRYTTDKPAADWEQPGFDDNDWKQAPAGFGRHGTPGGVVRTEWHSREIYLRKRFRLTEIPTGLILRAHFDDDIVVTINGQRVYENLAYRVRYENIPLPPIALQALVVGSNVIAVRVDNDGGGGQYIDLGVSTGILVEDDRELWKQRLHDRGHELLPEEMARNAVQLLLAIDTARLSPVREAYPAPVAFEQGHEAPVQYVHLRGNANVPGERVEPGYPVVLGFEAPDLPVVSTGDPTPRRRRVLARWLADPRNPLPARVMANRIWQFLFGRGLVATSSDFGRLGSGCSHPQLLDYLAAELVAGQWSTKRLIRSLLMTEAYRMSARADADSMARDPGNHTFWYFQPRRLTAEEVRDGILAVTGTLNRQMYGPAIYPPLPREVLETSSRPGAAWGTSPPDQQVRRSIYIHVKRSLREPLLAAFDQADTDSSCAVRFTTNVPTQTLMMLNSDFMQRGAAALCDRLEREYPRDLRRQVARAIRLALARKPISGEIERHLDFIAHVQEQFGVSPRQARESFALALLNQNEFIFLD